MINSYEHAVRTTQLSTNGNVPKSVCRFLKRLAHAEAKRSGTPWEHIYHDFLLPNMKRELPKLKVDLRDICACCGHKDEYMPMTRHEGNWLCNSCFVDMTQGQVL